MRIRRYIDLPIDKDQAVKLFESISKDPSVYQTTSHQGIFSIKGNFEKIGSTFETKEKILLFFITLKFKTVEYEPSNSISFRLIKPFKYLNLHAIFHQEELSKNKTRVYLDVTVPAKASLISKILASKLIFHTPTRWLIAKQLERELSMIADLSKSM